MLYDLSVILKDRSGKDLPYQEGQPLTVAVAVVNALDAPLPGETVSGADKAKRFVLGTKIMASQDSIDLSVEDAALCKKVVGEAYAPLIVGQVWEAFEAKKLQEVKASA